nr:hypothetical protein [Tanacetum cinerariifolium]
MEWDGHSKMRKENQGVRHLYDQDGHLTNWIRTNIKRLSFSRSVIPLIIVLLESIAFRQNTSCLFALIVLCIVSTIAPIMATNKIRLGTKKPDVIVEFTIIAGTDNRPPMLVKSLYDSWKSRMEFYLENRKNGRIILDSVQNGLLVWPTITEEDGTTRKKTYVELSASEKLQADCDCKATNIVLQGLAILVFNQGDDLISCLNKAMDFLTVVASSRVNVQQVQVRQGESYASNSYKGNAISSGGNNAGGQARVVKCYNCKGISYGQAIQTTISNNTAFQTEDLDAYDFDCDDVLNAKAVLMANLSNYGSDVILEPQVFYDDTHKQALGYQNPFYLKKAQRIKLTLYEGSVISSQHVASPVFDDEETLILEEVSRSKMLAKQKDPISKEKKVNTNPINYVELNRLSEDFGKKTVENAAQIPIATTIALGMLIDLEPLAPRLLNNRKAHIDYLKHTQEQADILRGIVEQADILRGIVEQAKAK